MRPDINNFSKVKQGSLTYNPLYYFIIFFIGNILLAYFPLGLFTEIWIGIMFILLPLALAFSMALNQPYEGKPLFTDEFLAKPPLGFWLFTAGCAVFLRFFQLVSLPTWPMWDDALTSYFSIKLMEQWHWQLWFTSETLPPFVFWMQALFFKVCPPSLFSIWFLSALQSLLVLPVGYWAVRKFFSRSFSLLFLMVLSFGFWTLYLGRFWYELQSIIIWQFLAIGCWGLYLKSSGSGQKIRSALFLGICLGLGPYISILTLPIIFIIGLSVIWSWWKHKEKGVKTLITVFIPCLILVTPLYRQIFFNFFTGHVFKYTILSHTSSFLEQMKCSLSYLTVFLWGTLDKSYFNFGPLWGGYLNPFLGSALLVGLVESSRVGRKFFMLLLSAFILCLLPGMLSSTLEMIRIISALPLCVFLTVLGWRKVALSFAPGRQIFAFVLLMIFSVSLDSYHLWGPCHQWAVPDKYTQGSKSPEHYQAFQILKKLNQESGFGLVFSDFYYDVFDQSLFVATYGFNAAANPGLLPSQAKWAAVIMAPWDVDTFKKRFPSAVFYDLSGKLAQDDQNKIWMAVVDLSGEREKALIGWVQIHKKTQDLFAVYPYHVPNASYQKILESLWKINAQAPAEPFIKNCLMEKIIDAAFQSSVISGAEPLAQIPSQALWHPSIFKQRCAVAFHRLGMWYFKQGRLSDARRLFLRAAELDPEYPLKKALALLNKN